MRCVFHIFLFVMDPGYLIYHCLSLVFLWDGIDELDHLFYE
jgi:hypothetical protein